MSNVNLILSNAINAARGDTSAIAASIADGISKSFSQLACHGQKTPFQNGLSALKGWKGELATTIETIILTKYQAALMVHQSKAKPTLEQLADVDAETLAQVTEAYDAEAARKEAKKTEAKAKREAAKAEEAKAEEAAKVEEASDLIEALAEVSTVRELLDITIGERDTLRERLEATQEERAEIMAQLEATREELEATREELEATREELQALKAAQGSTKPARKAKQAA